MENGSSDATADIAEKLSRISPEVRPHTLPDAELRQGGPPRHPRSQRRHRGAVRRRLLRPAVPEGRRGCCWSRPRTHQPAIVLGSKRAPGAHDERPFQRRAITAAFNFILHRGFGLDVTDTHGIKALDRQRLLPIIQRCELDADLFDTELVIRAGRAGLLIAELPVTVREQRPPRSSIVRRGLRTVAGLRRLRAALRRPGPLPST